MSTVPAVVVKQHASDEVGDVSFVALCVCFALHFLLQVLTCMWQLPHRMYDLHSEFYRLRGLPLRVASGRHLSFQYNFVFWYKTKSCGSGV
jgi:hypothetical protein